MNRIARIISIAAALITGTSLQAATISVNSTADVVGDDGICTLREAIIAANANFASGPSSGECAAGAAEPTVDQIIFDPAVSGAIMLSGTLGSINDPVEILGPGADVLALDASGFPTGQRILSFLDASVVDGLTFRNAATGDSGALGILAPTTVRDCAFEDNTAADGGAIRSESDLTVERSRFTRNVATDFDGGAIRMTNANRLLIVRDSLFEMNEVRGSFEAGGAIQVGGSGHVTEISGSTFTANRVTGGGDGGAISIGGDALTVVNSTFSGNEADRSSGAVEAGTQNTVLHSVTITGNRADADGDGSGDAALDQAAGTPVTVRTSIIAGNIDEGGEAPDCLGNFTTDGFNLIGAAGLCSGFTDGVSGDQVGSVANPVDAGLEPLAQNGGPTPTHALTFDSPAIEGGDPAGCTAPDGSPLLVDQRDEPRPAPGGSICDIGAFELASVPTLTLDVFVTAGGSVQSAPAGIACPGDCSQDYAEGTLVELTASPDSGFAFDGWSGDCAGTSTCQVTMSQARSVQATFEPATVFYSIDVEIEGNGIGMVESTPAGIDCPGDCSASFESGELVTLNAISGGSSTFFGWRADCAPAGTGACQIFVDQPYRAIAIFGDGDLLFLDGFE
ncbi:MAG: choice-of-anchor Q domain-containing protein [Wenzhouxiangellaceae bacterium]